MKNTFKKNIFGFTLVELLGVIIILSVIALITYPIIDKTIKNSKEEALKQTIKNIEDAAYNYSVENDIGYSKYYNKIELKELKEKGYLTNSIIKNPVTNEELQGCVIYRWVDEIKQYEFTYDEECYVPIPDVTITFVDVNNAINEKGWANRDFYIKVIAENAIKYKWCSTTEEICEQNALIEGAIEEGISNSVLISNESMNNKVCVQAYNINNEASEIICSDSYKLDKHNPIIESNSENYVVVTPNTNVEAINYFNYMSNGISEIEKVECRVNDNIITTTESLSAGEYTLNCNIIKENGLTSNSSIKLGVNNCYDFNNQTGVITNYNCYVGNTLKKKKKSDVVIPYSINKISVKEIGNGNTANTSFNNKNITSVDFTNAKELNIIGDRSFKNNQISSLTISENVEKIGNASFYGNQLSNLELNSNLISIGNGAFKQNQLSGTLNLSKLTKLNILNGFGNNQITDIIFPPNIIQIGTEAFIGNSLINIIVPNSVNIIDGDAFKNNQITSLKLNNNLEKIGFQSFQNNKLSEIIIPPNLSVISERCFQNNQLTNLFIPSNVIKIENEAFSRNKISNITFEVPQNVTYLSGFNNNNLTAIDLTNLTSLETLGLQAFANNNITDYKLPSNLKKIEGGVFTNNKISEEKAWIYALDENGNIDYTRLASYGGITKDITIPTSVVEIMEYAFSWTTIQNVDFNNSPNLQIIGDQAFSYCKSLKELNLINLPQLDSIGVNSFAYSVILNVKFDNLPNLKIIGGGSFAGTNITTIDLSDLPNLRTLGASSFGTSLETINIGNSNNLINIESNALNNVYGKLKTIINNTGNSFNWSAITNSTTQNQNFVTGTIIHQKGNIEVITN